MNFEEMNNEEWKVLPASEFCEKVADGTHDSPKKTDKGKLLVTSKNVVGGSLDLSKSYYISESDYNEINKRSKVDSNDVLLSMIGTVGEPCLITEDPDFAIKNVGLLKNEDPIKARWLYFYLLSPQGQSLIRERTRGSTQQYIPLGEIRSLPIYFPSDSKEMESIVDQLSSLQDKIHLNQQTNETLESMAQAIFKSWFVDFDPVRAKMEAKAAGRDPNRAAMAAIAGVNLDQSWDEIEAALEQRLSRMSTDQRTQLRQTAELFPDELVESEIGEVPKGWEVVEIQVEMDFQNGKAFRSKDLEKDLNKGLRVFKMGNIKKGGGFERVGGNDFLPPDFEDDISRYLLKKGDLLMCMTDMKNNVALLAHTALMDVDDEYVLNQRVGRLRRKVSSYLRFPFLYYLTNSERFIKNLRSRANSGVQVNLSTNEIKVSKFILPPEGVHNHFDQIVGDLLEQKFHNDKEVVTLSKIRDTLLPKLISGEVGV